MSLRERLLRYLKSRPNTWSSSGELQRLTALHTKHTPRSAVRRLQEMAEEGVLVCELRKNHSWYKFATKQFKEIPQTPPKTLEMSLV